MIIITLGYYFLIEYIRKKVSRLHWDNWRTSNQ